MDLPTCWFCICPIEDQTQVVRPCVEQEHTLDKECYELFVRSVLREQDENKLKCGVCRRGFALDLNHPLIKEIEWEKNKKYLVIITSALAFILFAKLGEKFALKIESVSLVGRVMLVGYQVIISMVSIVASSIMTIMVMSPIIDRFPVFNFNENKLFSLSLMAVIDCTLFVKGVHAFNKLNPADRIREISAMFFGGLGGFTTYRILKRIV